MRVITIFLGALLGVLLGCFIGVVAGISAHKLWPPPPGHALDGISLIVNVAFGCTVGGVLAGWKRRPDRQPESPTKDVRAAP